MENDLDTLCINSLRCLSADLPTFANSGHPGAPIGCAPMVHFLFSKYMNYNPENPKWFNRDRFVLSNGHACSLLYSILYLTGYSLTIDDLKCFRRLGSKTPGHPEVTETPGVELTTGPLGQGISSAVGLAIAEKHLASRFNRPGFNLIDNKIFVIAGDGCLQEGISSEACSLAGHLKLDNLIVLYDNNNITIDGKCNLSFTENVLLRFQSYGWHTLCVEDGNNDFNALSKSIEEAKNISGKPTIISVRTLIGYGSVKENSHEVHGAPLKENELIKLKEKFGFKMTDKFYVPPQVLEEYRKMREVGIQKENNWINLFSKYSNSFPELGLELQRIIKEELPRNWKEALPVWKPEDKPLATRQASQKVLNALAGIIPEIIGGSADLTPSTLTYLECSHDFQSSSYDGRYIRFGVREHAMAAILNGIAAYGGLIPFGATFLNFIQYALGAVRLSAISHFRTLYIMTHDSIGLGEDGPTHQPINAMAMLRAIPNILALRPCDGNETSGCYAVAIENKNRPSVLVLSRQNCPQIMNSSIEQVKKGGYIIFDSCSSPKLIFVASGSEVSICVEAAKNLDFSVRVVSMPCTTLFDEQSLEYKLSLFPDNVPVISCEAMSVKGWSEYSHVQHGMSTFGKSGSGTDVLNYFGFNAETMCEKAKKVIKFYECNSVPSLFRRPLL